MIKKIISIFLSAVLIFTIPAVAVSAINSGSDFGFAVASDLHYVHSMPTADDRAGYHEQLSFPTTNELQNESGYIIDEFLNQCAKNDKCNFVLITGDIVTFGRNFPEDHYAVAAKFRKFEKETGKQVYVINGNHDSGSNSSTDYKKFKEIYQEFGYDEAFSIDENSCSYAVNLNDKYTLIALDSCSTEWSVSSKITTEKLKWVKEQADKAKKSGRSPILMMHHNLLEHTPFQLLTGKKYIVAYPTTFATLFADWGIKLVFTGHTHVCDTKSYTSPCGNVIYDFSNPALNDYPTQYKVFNVTDSTIKYESKTVDTIDTDALTSAVSGYTDTQIAEMKSDFSSYAKQYYIKTNLDSFKQDNLNPETLKIKKSDPLYPLVSAVFTQVKALADMPLYGDDSVQQLAKEYNIDIPDSSYGNVWDIVAKIICDYTDGSKNYTMESPEINILLKVVALSVKIGGASYSDSTLLLDANKLYIKLGFTGSIADNLVKRSASVFGAITPADYFAVAIVSPIICGYLGSSSTLGNAEGEIPGYGSSNNNVVNIYNNITNNVNSALTILNMVIKIMLKSFNIFA